MDLKMILDNISSEVAYMYSTYSATGLDVVIMARWRKSILSDRQMKNGKFYGPFNWRFIKINLLFQFMHDRGITLLKAFKQ